MSFRSLGKICVGLAVIAVGILVGAGCGDPPGDSGEEPNPVSIVFDPTWSKSDGPFSCSLRPFGPNERPCHGDSFFIDLPDLEENERVVQMLSETLSDGSRLARLLEQELSPERTFSRADLTFSSAEGSVLDPCDQPWVTPEFTGGTVTAKVLPVLPKRRLGNGDLRFFRLRYFAEDKRGRTPLRMRRDRIGHVVTQIRKTTVNAINSLIKRRNSTLEKSNEIPYVEGRQVYVGRTCLFNAQLPAEAITEDMRTAHLKQMSVDDDVRALIDQQLNKKASVDVYLLDSGIDKDFMGEDAVNVIHEDLFYIDPRDPEQRVSNQCYAQNPLLCEPGQHPHGSYLAKVFRQIAPSQAKLHSIRIIDRNARFQPGDLARALDEIFFSESTPEQGRESNAPMIINLSLGWVQEMAERWEAPPSDGGPASGDNPLEPDPDGLSVDHEDSPVSAVYNVLKRAAEQFHRPFLVVAAAGNRPYRFPGTDEGIGDALVPLPTGQLMGPAHYYEDMVFNQHVVAVSAVDSDDRLTATHVPKLSPLAAVGGFVYPGRNSDDPLGNGIESLEGCHGTTNASVTDVNTAVTGSSVAAIEVSAAAAVAQLLAISGKIGPLNASQLTRVLYQSGDPIGLCTTYYGLGEGRPVRRLNLRNMISSNQIAQVENVGLGDYPFAGPMCGEGEPPLDEHPSDRKLVWNEDYIEKVFGNSACSSGFKGEYSDSCNWLIPFRGVYMSFDEIGLRCANDNYPTWKELWGAPFATTGAAGGASPQPPWIGCSDCSLFFDPNVNNNEFSAVLDLTGGFELDTSFEDLRIVVESPDDEKAHLFKLSSNDSLTNIGPGKLAVFRRISQNGITIDWNKSKATLVMEIKTKNGPSCLDTSPLRVQPYPVPN